MWRGGAPARPTPRPGSRERGGHVTGAMGTALDVRVKRAGKVYRDGVRLSR